MLRFSLHISGRRCPLLLLARKHSELPNGLRKAEEKLKQMSVVVDALPPTTSHQPLATGAVPEPPSPRHQPLDPPASEMQMSFAVDTWLSTSHCPRALWGFHLRLCARFAALPQTQPTSLHSTLNHLLRLVAQWLLDSHTRADSWVNKRK